MTAMPAIQDRTTDALLTRTHPTEEQRAPRALKSSDGLFFNEMNRLFGYNNKRTSDQLLQESSKAMDQAQQGLNGRISQLDTQIAQLNFQLQGLQKKIAGMGSAVAQRPLRQRALKLLNKRKQLETSRDQLDSQLWSMSQAQMTTENLKNTAVTVNALAQTNKALRQQYKQINVERLQTMQDEMADLMEQGEELQQVLAMGGTEIDDISESELDAELEALGDGELDFGAEADPVDLPAYLGGAPQFVDEDATDEPAGLQTAT
ncbi:ADR116Cp [Eremothecium gossypii ATCC 10895]|uniref:ADR116Cp n=1 Tax=Eremothecium gossypii (strain ATCC 10895 / CBS 109.51 / FGSC 9923 / NRRL Y-1056) TaxID=284811 RepID=Q75A14_EREGS|nr:ADR116Cp [Eremothecium gossypii ATCC 10895]AAS52036.1 ADR116Cp [Eremothecium gossypii ATCC 10895]AEY96335.1 FADR116Cp [Eremothecium gossypii FDAG1]